MECEVNKGHIEQILGVEWYNTTINVLLCIFNDSDRENERL